MHSKFKKIISLILVITILAAIPVYAAAAEARASAYFSSYSAYISTSGSGKIDVNFNVVGTGTMTKIGSSVVQIFKADGTRVASCSFALNAYSYIMGYNTFSHSASVPYAGVSGQRYYAIVTFFAKDSKGSDTLNYTTSTVTAK